MKRRDFLRTVASASLFAAAPRVHAATGEGATGWRTFELTYEIDLTKQAGAGRVWVPLPQHASDYQRVLSLSCKEANASLQWDARYQAPVVTAAWNAADNPRSLTVTSLVATRDRPRAALKRIMLDPAESALYLQPTESVPLDGIVRSTATKITQGARSMDEKALRIYEWVVDNTFRDPKVRGCGVGDIKVMLESGNLGGKCADINSLFVGLARAAGVPAREFFGVRVAESAQFKSLGKSGDISKAQHCRAEYFSPRHGWVAVDPADVRKAVLEENLALNDPKIVALRKRLFGYWEMNWVGFNYARDFALPTPASAPLKYLMYPYAEFGDDIIDGRDPNVFKFKLSSRQVA